MHSSVPFYLVSECLHMFVEGLLEYRSGVHSCRNNQTLRQQAQHVSKHQQLKRVIHSTYKQPSCHVILHWNWKIYAVEIMYDFIEWELHINALWDICCYAQFQQGVFYLIDSRPNTTD